MKLTACRPYFLCFAHILIWCLLYNSNFLDRASESSATFSLPGTKVSCNFCSKERKCHLWSMWERTFQLPFLSVCLGTVWSLRYCLGIRSNVGNPAVYGYGRFIALFMRIDFAISATPTSQGTLFTYLRYTWRQLWMCAKYLNSVYVAEFHGNSLHVWDDHSLKVRYSLSMTAAVSSPCAVLSSPSILKDLSCATGVRLRVRLSITVTVTIRVKISVSVYSYGSAWSYGFHILTGRRTTSHILVKNRNSITQHTSIN